MTESFYTHFHRRLTERGLRTTEDAVRQLFDDNSIDVICSIAELTPDGVVPYDGKLYVVGHIDKGTLYLYIEGDEAPAIEVSVNEFLTDLMLRGN